MQGRARAKGGPAADTPRGGTTSDAGSSGDRVSVRTSNVVTGGPLRRVNGSRPVKARRYCTEKRWGGGGRSNAEGMWMRRTPWRPVPGTCGRISCLGRTCGEVDGVVAVTARRLARDTPCRSSTTLGGGLRKNSADQGSPDHRRGSMAGPIPLECADFSVVLLHAPRKGQKATYIEMPLELHRDDDEVRELQHTLYGVLNATPEA